MKANLYQVISSINFESMSQDVITTLEKSPYTMPDDATEDWYLGVLFIISQFERLTMMSGDELKMLCNSVALVAMYEAWKKFYQNDYDFHSATSTDDITIIEKHYDKNKT